jgi:hypothetical protein
MVGMWFGIGCAFTTLALGAVLILCKIAAFAAAEAQRALADEQWATAGPSRGADSLETRRIFSGR